MPSARRLIAASLPLLLLAACGSEGRTAAENEAVPAETGAAENRAEPDPGPASGAVEPSEDPGPAPDAVSHPDGYLPPAADPPPAEGPEPPEAGSTEPATATEDQYIRNKQAGS